MVSLVAVFLAGDANSGARQLPGMRCSPCCSCSPQSQPRPPLTESYLVGDWSYDWYTTPGVVTFREDGTLVGYDGNGSLNYTGHWSVQDGDLHLILSMGDYGRRWGFVLPVGRVPMRNRFESSGQYRGESKIVFRREVK